MANDPSIREALNSAFESTTNSEEASSETVANSGPGSMVSDVQENARGSGAGALVSKAADGQDQEQARGGQDVGRVRDEHGRFSKGDKTPAPSKAVQTSTEPVKAAVPTVTDAPKAATQTATEPPKPAETTPSVKPPQSLRPSFREQAEWSKLPANWQQELLRREKEMQTGLQETAEARKFHAKFQETITPYLPFITAAGHEPLESVRTLMQTAANLRTGTPHERGQMVWAIMQQFGIPVEAVNAAMGGQAGPQQPHRAPPMQDVREIVNQTIQERLQAVRAERATAALQKAAESLEFFNDIGQELIEEQAAILIRTGKVEEDDFDGAIKRAYHILVAADPELSAIEQQRQAAKAAAASQHTAQRAKDAASSVKASPAAGGPTAQPNSLRAQLEANFSSIAGR